MTEKTNYQIIQEIYPASHEETKAIHREQSRTSHSGPRLRSVNDLHHDGSKLRRGPLARVAVFLVTLWNKLNHIWVRWMKALYPRCDVIYGNQSDASLVGRLTFSQRWDGHVPLHHMYLEFWGRSRLGKWMKFASGSSDQNGCFELPFDMMAVHGYNVRSVRLEIYHTGQFVFREGKAKPVYSLFHIESVKKSNLTGMAYDLGMIQLHYWEYRRDIPLPRVVIRDHDKDAPEQYAPGRLEAIEKQFIPVELITKRHLVKLDINPTALTIEEIQAAYPENLTGCMERVSPGITRTDEWFGIRFMNGMFATTFDKDPENQDLYWVYFHWRTYDHNPEIYAIPDVSLKFKMQDSGYVLPVEITLKGRLRPDGDLNERVVVHPGDGVRWEGAKRVARVSAALATEVDKHFAETHVNTEQYAIAARRNIRRNPIGALLFPHLKEVTLINYTADQILIGDNGYIAVATALKASGLIKRVYDVMGTLDWKNWVPLKPLSDKHTYARVSNLFFDLVRQDVTEFVRTHKSEIIEEWFEIYRFSEDLVAHSVPLFMCNYLRNKLHSDDEGRVTNTPDHAWYERDNRMDLTMKRPHFSVGEAIDKDLEEDIGEHETESEPSHIVKALSRLTSNNVYDPQSGDMDDLIQLCCYVIFQSTFGHYWSNSKQYDDIGEIRYSSLGIRLGSPEYGVLGPEDDDTISPSLKISTQMMWWSNMLSRTGYGFITANEEDDINPQLIALLQEHAGKFTDLDIDIDDIQSRTNI